MQRQTEHGQLEEAEQSQQNTEMLVSVLEEQFRTLETWLIPVHKNDADRVEYFQHLMERFETMVSGPTPLMNALKKNTNHCLKNQNRKPVPSAVAQRGINNEMTSNGQDRPPKTHYHGPD